MIAPIVRVRCLALFNRGSDALPGRFRLLDHSPDREKLLLVLAQLLRGQYRGHEAAVLTKQAMQHSHQLQNQKSGMLELIPRAVFACGALSTNLKASSDSPTGDS